MQASSCQISCTVHPTTYPHSPLLSPPVRYPFSPTQQGQARLPPRTRGASSTALPCVCECLLPRNQAPSASPMRLIRGEVWLGQRGGFSFLQNKDTRRHIPPRETKRETEACCLPTYSDAHLFNSLTQGGDSTAGMAWAGLG